MKKMDLYSLYMNRYTSSYSPNWNDIKFLQWTVIKPGKYCRKGLVFDLHIQGILDINHNAKYLMLHTNRKKNKFVFLNKTKNICT